MELLGHVTSRASIGPSVWFDAVHPEDLDRVREVLRVAVDRRSEPVVFEHRVRGVDGTYHSSRCRALPVGPADGPAYAHRRLDPRHRAAQAARGATPPGQRCTTK